MFGDPFTLVLFGVFIGALVAAMVWDFARFEIPDTVSLLLCAAAVTGLVMGGADAVVWLRQGVLVLGVFVAGFVLFAFGIWGGGDVKLLTALALWFAPFDFLSYLVAASICGGGLALGLMIFRRIKLSETWLSQPWLARLHDRNGGVPYGIALGAGGLWYSKNAVSTVLGVA